MTNTQKNFVEMLKYYFAMQDSRNYNMIMQAAQKDKRFEKMVQSMTVDRLNGGSILAKNNIQFK